MPTPNRSLSIGVLRQRVKRYADTLVADGPTATTRPQDYLIFSYQTPNDPEWIVITQEEFEQSDAPPGKYSVDFWIGVDPITQEQKYDTQVAEIRIERIEREDAPGKLRDMERCAAGLVHTANSESTRAHARLESEEKRHDATKEKLRLKEEAHAALLVENLQLRAALEAADDTEESAFGEVVVALLAKWLGMDNGAIDERRAAAVEVIIRKARTDKAVQRALIKAGAANELKLLQEGGDEPTNSESAS